MTDRALPQASSARLWGFAGTAFLLAPLLSFGFGLLTRQFIMFGFPLVTAVLLFVSVLFGLWRPPYGVVVKTGVVLWSLALGWMAFGFLIVAFSFYCGVLTARAGS